jgi:hypothetical protein
MLKPSTETFSATSKAPLMISSTLIDPRSRRCRLSVTACLANSGNLHDFERVIVSDIVRLLVALEPTFCRPPLELLLQNAGFGA